MWKLIEKVLSSKPQKVYEANYQNNAKSISSNVAKKGMVTEDIPQYEQQRRAMQKIYTGGKNSGNNFGVGVGP